MCPETEKGNYGVVLASHDASKQESIVAALQKAFRFDAKTSNTVLERAPIVIFDGLTEAIGKLVLEKMKGLSDAGCELKLVAAPFETKRKLSWPRPHTFVRQATDKADKAPTDDTAEITCPKCGEKFSLTPKAAPPTEAPPVEAEAPPAEAEAPPVEAEAPPVEAEAPPVETEAPPIEVPAPVEVPASENIMDLDDFETSLGEIEIESPFSGDDGEEEFEVMAGAQAVESEKPEAPPQPKGPPPELQKTVRYEKPKEEAPKIAVTPEGDGAYRVILSKMRSDKTRNDAAEIIAQVRGISKEEALDAAGKLIVTAVKDVPEEKANEIKNLFAEKGIKAIVSKRK